MYVPFQHLLYMCMYTYMHIIVVHLHTCLDPFDVLHPMHVAYAQLSCIHVHDCTITVYMYIQLHLHVHVHVHVYVHTCKYTQIHVLVRIWPQAGHAVRID